MGVVCLFVCFLVSSGEMSWQHWASLSPPALSCEEVFLCNLGAVAVETVLLWSSRARCKNVAVNLNVK